MDQLNIIADKVEKHSEQIIEIRIQLSTFNLVKTIVFAGTGMMLTSVFGGMITAAIYFISQK